MHDPKHDPARQNAEAAFVEGNALMQAGRFAEAQVAYERALALNPTAPRAHCNLAVAFAEQRLFDRALAHYREALRLDPTFIDAHYNLGNALRELARHAEAVASYDRALAINPGWPLALLNRGLALAAQGHQALAEASYRKALLQRPDYPEAHNNLGLALEIQGSVADGMKHFDRALALAPTFANAHSNRAQLRLLLGDLRNGWPEYQWRWRLPGTSLQPVDVPAWDGGPVAGRSVLLRAEQGFGDTIQFVRFASALRERGCKVVVECQPALASLLARARGVDLVVPRGGALPPCDIQIPVASLPAALGVFDIAAIPAQIPYLTPDPELIAHWRDRLRALQGFKVGIAWRGHAAHPQDCHRSIPAQRFAALAAVPGVTLVTLQVGESAPDSLPVVTLGAHRDNRTFTFDGTAAIVANLDLIVTCDTALAHLAGALGAPLWIALPVIPDWRWLLDRDDSPWYPTARLFRQTRLDDWDELFARIAAALAEHTTTHLS